PDPTFVFAQGTESGVLYWTSTLSIGEDENGALVTTAALQRNYAKQPSPGQAATVVVPIRFPAPEAGTPVTGSLICTPNIDNVGLYAATSPTDNTSGNLTFAVPVSQATDFVCTALYIDVNGAHQKYSATLSGDAGKIHGVPGQTVTLTEVDVTLAQPTP